jgi:hypothetical protein
MDRSKRAAIARVLLAALLAAMGVNETRAAFSIHVEYLDEAGRPASADGKDATYVYYRRINYSVPRGAEGATFRDEASDARAFPFASKRIRFGDTREVAFEWKEVDGRETLLLRFDMSTGVVIELPAATLEGASHPRSPVIRLVTPAGPLELPIDPVTPAAKRAGHPQIRRIVFPGSPDLRRK